MQKTRVWAVGNAARKTESIMPGTASQDQENGATPEKTDRFRGNAYKEPKPGKITVTIRLDADVITWLKSPGRGYQTRINRLLRQAMHEEATDLARTSSGDSGKSSATVIEFPGPVANGTRIRQSD